jgi:hypothetical protein
LKTNPTSRKRSKKWGTHYAASFETPAGETVARRTAHDIAMRVNPLIIMLTPTSIPMAQIALNGHCT